MDFSTSDDQREIREAVRELCARFPDAYGVSSMRAANIRRNS